MSCVFIYNSLQLNFWSDPFSSFREPIASEGGDQHVLVIRRFLCRKIHHELPDCVVPYKQYEAACVEQVVSSPFAIIRTLWRSRPSLRRLYIMLKDTMSGTQPAGWRELSARSSIQICGYIPVLHSCPVRRAVDSSRSLPSEVQ
jgi:hypothetical protein